MSGFPNLPDIELLRAALATINKERAAIDRAREQAQHYHDCIEAARNRLHMAEKEMKRLMAAMDCEQTGNTGYENRLMALLTGLSETAENYGRSHP